MAELKTKKTKASVTKFINAIENERRRKEAKILLNLFKKITKEKPVMWGTSIIGFGQYYYESERSSQKGDWMLTAFSPRKTSFSLYIMPRIDTYNALLKKLGKHKTGVCCLYINKLDDVDMKVLEELITKSFKDMKKRYKK